MKRFSTITDFCREADISRATAYRENKAGRLPFCKIGRATRIDRADIERWFDVIKQGQQPSI